MQSRFLFLVLSMCTCVLVVSFDIWGQMAFLRTSLSLFAPSKDEASEAGIKNKNLNTFPKNFIIGASSSAYQIEGAWNEDGKSPSIWDDFVHLHSNVVADNSTGDVSADSYHDYLKDIEALKLVGVNIIT